MLHPSQMTPEQIDALRHKPKGAARMAIKGTNAIAFTAPNPRHENGVVICAYIGKSIKPSAHYSFRTRERAAEWLNEFRAGLIASAESRAARKADRAKPHTLQVGDVMRSSWGYDQTNIDYYQITRTGNRCVWARPIKARSVETGSMCGQCKPDVGAFCGDERRYVVSHGNAIKVRSFAYATKCDPNQSSYWSSYA